MEIRLEQIDPDALRVVQRLLRYQHKAYLVGGCVRDLLLGRKPKDFDVATSATPNEIRRCFRNCRIIGRRFRLAHVFFGRKIIETATFRANPRAAEDETGEAPIEEKAEGTPSEKPNDLLIRHDNVFGTEEEDARRRDFTINGLFFDVQNAQVIDHVAGLPDLGSPSGAHHRRSRYPVSRRSGAHPARREVRCPLRPNHRGARPIAA